MNIDAIVYSISFSNLLIGFTTGHFGQSESYAADRVLSRLQPERTMRKESSALFVPDKSKEENADEKIRRDQRKKDNNENSTDGYPIGRPVWLIGAFARTGTGTFDVESKFLIFVFRGEKRFGGFAGEIDQKFGVSTVGVRDHR